MPKNRGCVICYDEIWVYQDIDGVGRVMICSLHSRKWQTLMLNTYMGVHADFLVASAAFRRMMSGWPDISGSFGTDRTTALQFIEVEKEMAAIWEEFVEDEQAQLAASQLDSPSNEV